MNDKTGKTGMNTRGLAVLFLLPALVFPQLDTAALADNTWVSVWPTTQPLTINGNNWAYENDLGSHPFYGFFILGPGHVIHPQDCYWYPYDPLTNKWTKTNPPTRPTRQCLSSFAVSSQDTAILQWGGAESSHQLSQGEFLDDYRSIDYKGNRGSRIWAYQFNANRWHFMEGVENLPPNTHQRYPRYDALHDISIGVEGSIAWVYNFHTNKAASHAIPTSFQVGGYANAVDEKRGIFYILSNGAMWSFNPETSSWSKVTGTTVPAGPKARTDRTTNPGLCCLVYDPLHDMLLYLNDEVNETGLPSCRTWGFNCETRQWSEITPLASPTDMGRLAFNKALNLFMLFGGTADAEIHRGGGTAGLWVYRYSRDISAYKNLAPAPLPVLDASAGTARLSWKSVPGAQGYNIHRGDVVLYARNFSKLNGSPVTDTFYTDGTAAAATHYAYRVTAVKGGVEGLPSRLAYSRPGRPLGLAASVEESTKVKVSWLPNPEPGITGYNIYRARGTSIYSSIGGYAKLNVSPVAGTFFLDSPDLSDGVARGYVVSAVNGLGLESGYSPVATTFPGTCDWVWTLSQMTTGGLKMALRWMPPERTKILGVNLYRCTSPLIKVNSTLITDSVTFWPMPPAVGGGGAEGATQTYIARAVNILGQEGFSSDQVSPANMDYGYGMVTPTQRFNYDQYKAADVKIEQGTSLDGKPTAALRPNPFNPVTTLTFDASNAGTVRIGVYSTDGRLLKTFSEKPRNNRLEKNIGFNGMPAGVYMVRVHDGEHAATLKAVYLK